MRKAAILPLLVVLLISPMTLLSENNLTEAQKIGRIITGHLSNFDSKTISNAMKLHYEHMRLIDKFGNWAAPELEAISDNLLPNDLDERQVKIFVWLMAHYANSNEYLRNFLFSVRNEDFPLLFSKVESEGAVVFPDLVGYALTLERLTKAMHDDWRIIEVCQNIWGREMKESDKKKSPGFFIKLESVKMAIKRFIKYHKSGVVPAGFARNLLPMNILEAAAFDVGAKHFDNAIAGKILAKYRPGNKHQDKNTGIGPTVWAPDKKAILVNMPYSRQWADLYGTWNLAFVSQLETFPYWAIKLLIPQVNNYELRPAEYIYNRALALYTTLYYMHLRPPVSLKWSDKKLTQLWGIVNKESARKYENLVQREK